MLGSSGQQRESSKSVFITVIVLYYKRPQTIVETVRSITQQDYIDREIIVIDNHSEDGLVQRLNDFSAEINVITLPENRGATGGRNAAIRVARGEVIVFLDDDVSFMSSSELSKIAAAFERRSDIDVLAFKICDPDTGELRLREWCHPKYWKEFSDSEFETHWFCEGASAFRRKVFETCGLYYEPLFYGPEGHDLAMRLLNSGFRILHYPRVQVGHRAAQEGRTSNRQYFYFTRDFIWMACKDYHLIEGIRFVIPKLLMMFYFAVRSNAYVPFFRGIWHGLRGLPTIARDRTPISRETVRYISTLDKDRPSLFVRFARHKTGPQV